MRRSLVVATVLLFAPSARAACGPEAPWVRVSFEGAALAPEVAASILADLAAELSRQGIDACTQGTGTPVASVTVAGANPESVAVAIDVTDGVTEKRIGRDVDLVGVPDDGRSLAIALATEDLLTASWAELALRSAEPPRPPPREVTRTVERAIAPRAPTSAAGARFGLEWFGGGQTHLGGDAFSQLWLLPRAGLELAFELRQGLATSSAHGTIDARALGGSAGLVFAILPRTRRLRLHAGLGISVSSVTFEGSPSDAADASDPTEVVVVVRATVSASLALAGPIHALLAAGAGWPLRGYEGTDFGQEATGATGLELHGRAGLSVDL